MTEMRELVLGGERPAIAPDLDASDAVIALTAEDRPM
jgi:hypothetical protein